jgi:hypothetical protein
MTAMSRPETSRRMSWYLLAASFLVCFGVWHWADNLLIPRSTQVALAGGRPIGNNSDLYPRWLGAREMLVHHRNPYSAEVTREIQIGYYGRPLNPANPADPVDQQAFAYPLYVVFLMAPSVLLPFSMVMKVFGWLLLGGTAWSVALWMQALARRPNGIVRLAAIVLVLGTYPVLQGFYKQQLTLLVGFLLAAAAAAIVRDWLVLGGFLLALSTIKPQISGLLVFWFVVWAIGDWGKRKRFLWSFAGTMAALMLGAEALLPGWIRDFLAAVREYRRYAADQPILQHLLTGIGGEIAAALLLALLAAICWRWRKERAGSARFGWAIVLALTINLTILNKIAPYNEVLLIPALLVLPGEVGKVGLAARAVVKATFACQIWQWLTALLLAAGSYLIPVERLQWAVQIPLYTIFALTPLTLLSVLLCLPRAGIEASQTIPRTPAESRV